MWHLSLNLTTLKGDMVLSRRGIGKSTWMDIINMELSRLGHVCAIEQHSCGNNGLFQNRKFKRMIAGLYICI